MNQQTPNDYKSASDKTIRSQGRREDLDACGQNYEMGSPSGEASRKCFRSSPFDWLKMHFRTYPTVKLLNIFNFEAP